MAKILILDYSTDQSEAPAIQRWLPSTAEVTERFVDKSVTHFDDLRLERFTHIIHSGSALSIMDEAPFTAAAEKLIREACGRGIGQFGICYGQQLLCRTLVGPHAVRSTPKGLEVGWGEVRFTALGQTLLGVRQVERVWQYHFDEVTALPPGSALIATNEHTQIQAFVHRESKLLGVQFHPEFDHQEGNRIFLENAENLAKHGFHHEALTRGAPTMDAGTLFLTFFLSFKKGGDSF